MRVSTGMIYDAGLASMQKRTGSLLRSQQQLAEGRRILRPSDDPVAAARALEVTQAKEVNANQATARDNAKTTLALAESQLQSAGDLMVLLRERTVQAGNASLGSADRRSIANELRVRFDEMVALANSRDGTGLYLFGGYQTGNQPFAGSVEHGVAYSGDDGARMLRVSGSRELPISDSGNDLFMRIKNGNGVFSTSTQYDKPANSSQVTVTSKTVSNPAFWNAAPSSLEVRFWTDTTGVVANVGEIIYDIVDPATGDSVLTGAPAANGAAAGMRSYVSGMPIDFSSAAVPVFDFGASLTASGVPADGDVLAITRPIPGAMSIDTAGVATSHSGAVIDKGVVTDPVRWASSTNSQNLEVRFWVDTADAMGGGAGTTYYDLVDGDTGDSVFTGNPSTTGALPAGTYSHAYTSGAPITLSSAAAPVFDFGASVTVTGTVATGDTFTIKGSPDAVLGNGFFVTDEKKATAVNTGSGIIGAGAVLDVAKWNQPANSRNLEVRFWKDTATDPAKLYYDLVDAETEKSLFTGTNSTAGGGGNTFTHAFVSGDAIPFSGLNVPDAGPPPTTVTDFGISVAISGTPASGDRFKIEPSTSESVFDTMGRLITTLENGAPVGTAGNTHLANELSTVLTSVGQIEDNLLRGRAAIGSRMAEIDDLDTVGENLDLKYAETLSNLQDLDYAEAITRLTRQQTELQASQQSFARISQLSLFDYLG